MRQPLRSQILFPVLGLMLVAMIFVSATSAALAARRTRLQLEAQLREVARTLVESTFPLTDAVLRQTHGLSGAEFLVTDAQGRVTAASRAGLAPPEEPAALQKPAALRLDHTVSLGGESYFHAAVKRQPRRGAGEEQWVHLFYPERQWRRAWREAVGPPLAAGGVSLLVAAALATWLAERWTRPIARLRSQVEQIAQGDFRPLPLPHRDDEIRDLAASVNRMAEMLARYEEEVRRRERLRTLGQLGGGIAHQMRNAATGCRMALDLHRRQSPTASDDENLSVAVRQLELMETYLRRFLTLGAEHAPPRGVVDLRRVVEDVLPLVRPTAAHLGVELDWRPPDDPLPVRADATGLAQLVVNLTLNAIEAASGGECPEPGERRGASPTCGSRRTEEGEESANVPPKPPLVPAVELRLARDGERVRLEVIDTGPGPAPTVQDRLFEPLVSDKPDGAGLGLAVAREIAQLHQGEIHWERRGGRTLFLVQVPLLKGAEQRVAPVGG